MFPPPAAKKKNLSAAEVFQIPGARRRGGAWMSQIARPLAACFLMAAFLWMASTAMRLGTHTAAVNHDVATLIDAERGTSAGTSAAASTPPGKAGPAPAASETGWFGTIRQAVASRAASQVTETFHTGMAAWGDSRGGAPSGWTHNPEGYVMPASLALFRPSLNFRDYRMEFFGEIERKGISWAVRARDPRNYYAMRVSVVEPGPRPMIAIEHYPVVEGIRGHHIRVPLPEVMFHNHTPYRVDVAVSGNRITTSIEGQEVDWWTDDSLPKGGVGFFAEANERARIYWMKVTRNEDFLGRICAYLSGSSEIDSDTAALWPEETPFPGAPGAPPAPAPRAEVALAALFDPRGPNYSRRFPPWKL